MGFICPKILHNDGAWVDFMGLNGENPLDAEACHILAEELKQLLANQLFIRAPVLSRLLIYLVEHRLENKGPAPKAYAIATEALGRPADFDASVDSYPRVMVGRLRSLMDKYYSQKAWLHRLRIPHGSYEVVVQFRTAPPTRPGASAGADSDAGTGRAMAAGAGAAAETSHKKAGEADEHRPHAMIEESFAASEETALRPKSFVPLMPRARQNGWAAGPLTPEAFLADMALAPVGPAKQAQRTALWKRRFWMTAIVVAASLLGGAAALVIDRYAASDNNIFSIIAVRQGADSLAEKIQVGASDDGSLAAVVAGAE